MFFLLLFFVQVFSTARLNIVESRSVHKYLCASQPVGQFYHNLHAFQNNRKKFGKQKMTKKPCSRANQPASQLAHLVVIATHEFNFIYICKLFHYNFSAVRMSSLSSFACRAALNLGELTNLTVDKKHSHALYHHGRLHWYDMILFFLSRFQHFSFPVTEQSRSGKRVNQRKSGRKKMAERADAKRKIKQCKWKQSSAEQSQMQYHICVIVIQPLCAWFFSIFQLIFLTLCVCACLRKL